MTSVNEDPPGQEPRGAASLHPSPWPERYKTWSLHQQLCFAMRLYWLRRQPRWALILMLSRAFAKYIDSGIPADAWPQVKLPDCDEVIRTFPQQLELFSE